MFNVAELYIYAPQNVLLWEDGKNKSKGISIFGGVIRRNVCLLFVFFDWCEHFYFQFQSKAVVDPEFPEGEAAPKDAAMHFLENLYVNT